MYQNESGRVYDFNFIHPILQKCHKNALSQSNRHNPLYSREGWVRLKANSEGDDQRAEDEVPGEEDAKDVKE